MFYDLEMLQKIDFNFLEDSSVFLKFKPYICKKNDGKRYFSRHSKKKHWKKMGGL
jgi:hypothetical protein